MRKLNLLLAASAIALVSQPAFAQSIVSRSSTIPGEPGVVSVPTTDGKTAKVTVSVNVDPVTGAALAGSAVSISDGADSTLGAKADAAAAGDTSTASLIALIKRNNQRITSLMALFPAAVGQTTKANSLAVALPTDPDLRPASANITVVDSGTSTVAGQAGVTLVTGTPTASSFSTIALNGQSSVVATVTGTFVATAQIESSADGGTTYALSGGKIFGSSQITSNVTAPGMFRVDTTGITNLRVRAIAYTSGTATVQFTASSAAGASQIMNPVRAGDFKHLISSTMTRINNTAAYAGTSTNPVAICLFTSSTVCAPLTVTVSSTVPNVDGYITSLKLVKSTTGATAATFVVLAYQAAPTLTSVFDTTIYTPKLADITASPTKYIGKWTCGTQIVNGDNSTYDCTSATNNGIQAFNLTDGIIRFVLLTDAAYAPGDAETFYAIADITSNLP